MPLDSYDGLVASIGAWLMRDDLSAVIPDFISLAETDMNNRLRLRTQLVTATVDAAGGDLPADAVHVQSVTLDGYGRLAFASGAENAEFTEGYRGGPARWFGIDGNKLVVSPTPANGSLTLRYYARIPALGPVSQTNAVLEASPGLYLYGSLLQAAPYLLDDQRVQTWGTLYTQAADLLQASDDAAEFPGPLVIRSAPW